MCVGEEGGQEQGTEEPNREVRRAKTPTGQLFLAVTNDAKP